MTWADKFSATWQPMFAFAPHKTLEGRVVWLQKVYVRFGGYRYPWSYYDKGPWSEYTLTPDKYPDKKK